jgi:hypothetical protein
MYAYAYCCVCTVICILYYSMYHRTCVRACEHILCTMPFRAFMYLDHFPVLTSSCTFLCPCSAVHSCAHVQLYIPVPMFSCTFLCPCSTVHSCAHVQLYIPVPMFSCTFLCPCSAVHSCAHLSCTFLCSCSLLCLNLPVPVCQIQICI